jgi:hypothetical protein
MITLFIIFVLIYIITVGLELFVIDDSIEYYLSGLNDFIFILLLAYPVINTIVVTVVSILIIIKKIRWKIKYRGIK